MFQFLSLFGFFFCELTQFTKRLVLARWTEQRFQVNLCQHNKTNLSANNHQKKKASRRKEIPIISQLAQIHKNFTRTLHSKFFISYRLLSRPSRCCCKKVLRSVCRSSMKELRRTKVRNILQIFILVSDRCLIRRVEGVLKNKVSSCSCFSNNTQHSGEILRIVSMLSKLKKKVYI